jgi:predicted site-specific integrase-resolvase
MTYQTAQTNIDLDALNESTLLSPQQVSTLLGIKAGTLEVWRCTGRYDLPYVKAGRLIRYRAGDVLRFISGRVFAHTDKRV